jgi:radical SAM protein with 4Fe4S-binding SPASM domain
MILRPNLGIQFHLTVKCDSRCKHCYQFESDSYASELKNELSLSDVLAILDDYENTLVRWNANGFISFSGGDPMLRDDLLDIVRHASSLKRVQSVNILGNPYHITAKTAEALYQAGVRHYQISIDGNEATHDDLRLPGSYHESIRALKLLKKAGIDTAIMFTLSKRNHTDLLDVIHLANEIGVGSFTFARLSSIGHGKILGTETLHPNEFRAIYLAALKEYDKIIQVNDSIRFPKKDHLWVPLFWELGHLNKEDLKRYHIGKCGMGERHLTILSDGTAVACRRLPIPLGKLPHQSIRKVFLESKFLHQVRDIGNFEKCGRCRFGAICLGGPAVAHGHYGRPFAPDPQCWVEPD